MNLTWNILKRVLDLKGLGESNESIPVEVEREVDSDEYVKVYNK